MLIKYHFQKFAAFSFTCSSNNFLLSLFGVAQTRRRSLKQIKFFPAELSCPRDKIYKADQFGTVLAMDWIREAETDGVDSSHIDSPRKVYRSSFMGRERANSFSYPREEVYFSDYPFHYDHRLGETSRSSMIYKPYEWGTPKSGRSPEKLSHENQVKPSGYCCKDEEFMQNETLLKCKNHIGGAEHIEKLSWNVRLKIAIGIARGLNVLHNLETKCIHKDFKASNILLTDGTSPKSIEKVNAMDAGEFTALDVSSVSKLSGKTGMKTKRSRLGDEDEAEKAFKWWNQPSHLQNNWPDMGRKNESQSNVYPLLLLIMATLVSIITFHTALNIRGCRSEEGYGYNSSLNPICQIVNRDPLLIRLVIAFNSVFFFLSMALMMFLFNGLPLRPLLLVTAFSMLGAYMCTISGTFKPPLSSS